MTQSTNKTVFFHLLKTGGTTFRGILSSIYGASFHVCVDPSIAAITSALARFDCIEFHTLPFQGDFVPMHREVARLRRWDLLEGLDVFAMFREPVDQVISQYHAIVEHRAFIEPAYKANGIPFPQTLEAYLNGPWHFNNQLAFLIGKHPLATKGEVGNEDLADAKQMLLQLQVHAGLTERFSDAVHVFETVTGRRIADRKIENRNQNPNRPPLEAVSGAMQARIRERSALDIELYQFARDLFAEDLARCGSPAPVYSFRNVVPADHLKSTDLRGKGYTIQPFLDAAEIEALERLHHETTPVVPSDYYVSAFSTDVETKRRIFEGITGIVKDKVTQLAPGYRILMASFVTKRACSTQGRLGLHQDYSLVDHAKHLGLNVWSPLCDVDQRNGCLRVVENSPAFGHISATPPNPSPYDDIRLELESSYMTDVPMEAGKAFLFDTRVLHATGENQLASDRTSVFLNLVPEYTTPVLYLWNREQPGQLEVYEVDSEFMLHLPPNQYPSDPEKMGAKRVGLLDYGYEKLSSSDLLTTGVRSASNLRPVASYRWALSYFDSALSSIPVTACFRKFVSFARRTASMLAQ